MHICALGLPSWVTPSGMAAALCGRISLVSVPSQGPSARARGLAEGRMWASNRGIDLCGHVSSFVVAFRIASFEVLPKRHSAL